jgi:hypothetical protein
MTRDLQGVSLFRDWRRPVSGAAAVLDAVVAHGPTTRAKAIWQALLCALPAQR